MRIQANDRILFLGDSITEQHLWTRYIENLLLWHEPSLAIRNRGWSATRAVDGVARFERDVTPFAPTWLFIAFGMNDGGYQPVAEHISRRYQESLTQLVDLARSIGAEPILCSPSCADEACDPVLQGYNQTLAHLTSLCQAVAEEKGCRFVDLFHPLLAAGPGLIPDGIHPGPQGHLVMAKALAAQLGLEQKARLGPDGTPEPILNYTFEPPALPAGDDRPRRYSVFVDGERCGNFAQTELAQGVEVTGGGLRGRAQAVANLTGAIWQMDYAAWRIHGSLGLNGSRSPAAAAACAAAVPQLEGFRRHLLEEEAVVKVKWEEPIHLTRWELSGPYPTESQTELLTKRFGPEPRPVDGGVAEVILPWQVMEATGPSGYVNLLELYGPLTQVVAYAQTSFEAPVAGELLLSLGSDDGYRLYVNGELKADLPIFRGSVPGQELHRIPINAGTNHLLLRIHQGIGGWDFYATAYLRPYE